VTDLEPIYFHDHEGPYGFLSNFAPFEIRLGGWAWPTAEHYFQAQKFAGRPEEERIRTARSPADAAALGWALGPVRPDWESVKEDVMLAALRAKFSQHPLLLAQLVETGARLLADRTATDAYWGDAGDGTGRNRLGELLMRVRGELR
jgi:ribA/ribD-fused uncharacterized protein